MYVPDDVFLINVKIIITIRSLEGVIMFRIFSSVNNFGLTVS